jgi:hypothetical protein
MKLSISPRVKKQITGYWLADVATYPLLLCLGAGVGLAVYQGARLLVSNPDTKVAVSNRNAEAGIRNNDAEGKSFYEHTLRKVASSNWQTMFAVNAANGKLP